MSNLMGVLTGKRWRDTWNSATAVVAAQQRSMAKAAQVAGFHAAMKGTSGVPPVAQRQLTDQVRTMVDPHMISRMSMTDVIGMVEGILRGHVRKLSADYVRKTANAVAMDLLGGSKRMSSYHNSVMGNQTPITTSTIGSFFNIVSTSTGTSTTSTNQAAMIQSMYNHMAAQQNAAMYQGSQFGTGSIASNVANTLYSSQHLMQQNAVVCPDDPLIRDTLRLMGDCSVVDGEACTIKLPDGAYIRVARDGSYQIDDTTAKVVYRASRMRDFNPFMNASDKLEAFIDYCGQQGVKKDEMLQLPIQLFIIWLVIEAAKADKEPEPDVKLLPAIAKHVTPHCGACGRFIARQKVRAGLLFCATACFDRAYQRLIPAPTPAAIAA